VHSVVVVVVVVVALVKLGLFCIGTCSEVLFTLGWWWSWFDN
jgi:hypothetical protein